jgi:hypothetical protein
MQLRSAKQLEALACSLTESKVTSLCSRALRVCQCVQHCLLLLLKLCIQSELLSAFSTLPVVLTLTEHWRRS